MQIQQKQKLDIINQWLQSFKFSKQIKNIKRDFSDAVLFAQILKQVDYKLVQINNYIPTSNYQQKLINWNILNQKALSKINCHFDNHEIEGLCKCQPSFAVDAILKLKDKIQIYLEEKQEKEIQNEKIIMEEDSQIIKETFTKKSIYDDQIRKREEKVKILQEKIEVKKNINLIL